jgi:hypothetical protein
MSWIVQEYLWTLKLPPNQKLVAMSLANHCHDDGTEARPGKTLVAEETGLSTRTVQTMLQELIKADIIRIDRPSTQHRPPSYVFLLPPSVLKRSRAKVSSLNPGEQILRQGSKSRIPGEKISLPNH